MPIYEYACSRCGHTLEALQKLADAALTRCPACDAESLVKKVSAAGFQLKGSGWYATDFRNAGAKPAADATKPAEASADGAKGESPKPSGDAPSEKKTETTAPAGGGTDTTSAA